MVNLHGSGFIIDNRFIINQRHWAQRQRNSGTSLVTESTDAGGSAWSPPERPDWVARVNQEGRYLDLDSVAPLDENSLLAAARARTGLSDFGDSDNWRESFQVFIKSLREEAQLNLIGRLMTRSDLINMLAARLEIEETYRLHPEIHDQQIVRPVMIVGQARTGTSLLLNVLSQDPGNGSLKHWECIYPCPPPERACYSADPRIDRAEHLVTQWNRVNPELASCHEFNARVPTEASHAMTLSFSGAPFLALLGQTPSHNAFLQQQGVAPGLLYLKKVLRLLQWKNPRKHWILKAPDAILYMPALLEVFPDMSFVWTHRDPLKASDSVINMYCNCMWVRSDNPFIGGVLEQMINPEFAGQLLNQPIQWMENGVIPPGRVCNILFLELEGNPLGEVTRLYAELDMDLSSRALAAMQQYMRDNPRSARPPANYSSIQADARLAQRQQVARYQEYFNVQSEC